MCQLLAVSSNKKVDIKFSLGEFRHRGEKNPHGWGFGFYNEDDNKWEIIKKPESLKNEDINKFSFKSKIIVGHVRLASCGNHSQQNTHPFNKDDWIFAHNGTVTKIMNNSNFKLNKFVPRGDTDSEYAFCYLLEKIEGIGNTQTLYEILAKEAEKIREYGKFNFLLANKEYLFAFGDNALFFVLRKAPFQDVTLKDEEYSLNLARIKASDEKAVVIATEPLTINEDWRKITGLKVFKNGQEIKLLLSSGYQTVGQ